MKRRYAIVLYGATGFTGRQAAAYLDRQAGGDLDWAIAGRDRARLENLRASLTSAPDVVVADASDAAAIDGMVGSTRVVLTTAGPYAEHGETLLRSCAVRGVDYADITGETPWVRRMIDRYDRVAADSGAKIVPFCGYDSVPSDLGVHLLVEHFRGRGQATREVRAFQRARGGINDGTVATLTKALESGDMRTVDDPFLLCPGDRISRETAFANRDPQLPTFDRALGRWVAPSLMARINTRVVRRSHSLSSRWQQSYGEAFRYQEYWDLGMEMDFVSSSAAAVGVGITQLMSMMPYAGKMLSTFARAAGASPNVSAMESGFFECRLFGAADDGATAWATIAGRGDPANRATVTFLCESGLALALDRERLPGGRARAGLLTPATALGPVLVARLRRAGMAIERPAMAPDPA